MTDGISGLLADARTVTGVTADVGYAERLLRRVRQQPLLTPAPCPAASRRTALHRGPCHHRQHPSEFTVDPASFILNSASITLDSGNIYGRPSTYEEVFFDTENNKVVYTIPAGALGRINGDYTGDTLNTLKFTLAR